MDSIILIFFVTEMGRLPSLLDVATIVCYPIPLTL